ncbi:MAG: hypothetical protein ABIL68_03570, partial [bacterium]
VKNLMAKIVDLKTSLKKKEDEIEVIKKEVKEKDERKSGSAVGEKPMASEKKKASGKGSEKGTQK